MPEELAKDAVDVINYLLPGFLAAWLFYGVTSHPKPSHFERVVQAVIFAFVIHGFISILKLILFSADGIVHFGAWNQDVERAWSFLFSVLIGFAFAHIVNTDKLHSVLRRIGLTNRTSHPSEWFYIFSKKVTFVVLHLSDGRRVYGWPKEWPIDADKGQFYIMLPSWIDEEGGVVDLAQLDGILIRARDVSWVEFLKEGEVDE